METATNGNSALLRSNVQLILTLISLLFCVFSNAQTPGLIFTPQSTSTIMDPNQDAYTSATGSGFLSSDLTESELTFFPITVPYSEPMGDPRRGSDGGITDIVFDSQGHGAYVKFDGTNLVFRLRVGGYSSGVYGFSILIDADMKLGNVAPYADPNYLAQTNTTNGNPGFEYEIVLEKGFKVGVYNVDGSINPSILASYPGTTNWQASKALTTANGDADYFIDFYVPLSALTSLAGPPVIPAVTSSTTLRMVATTSMNAAPSIGGTKSDINGINDDLYSSVEEAWTAVINSQPGFTPAMIGNGGTGMGPVCTTTPVVTAPISNGAGIVSGTWTSSTAASAKVYLYKNNSLVDSVNVNSGGTWSFSISTVTNDIFYTKAISSSESLSLESNHVKVLSCVPATTTAAPGVSCFTDRGAQGTMPSGATVTIYKVLSTGISSAGTTNLSYPTATTWKWESTNISGTGVCSGGPTDVTSGTYMVTSTQSGKCESGATSTWCVGFGATTATPVITQSNLYASSTTVSGTAPNPSTVRLFINGKSMDSYASTGTYSFTGLTLNLGDSVKVTAQAASQCMSAAALKVVTCLTTPPVISADASNKIALSSAIRGVSLEPAGAIVTIYNSGGVVQGTATVLSDGSWISSVSAASGVSYYAKQTYGSCGQSDASETVTTISANTSCPTINAVSEGSSAVTGGGSSNGQTIRLYEDGSLIGSVLATGATWSISISAPYSLYAGAILTATSQITGTNVESSCSQNIVVSCVAPAAPAVPSSLTTCMNSTVAITINSPVSGVIYTIRNQAGTTDMSVSKLGNGSPLTLTSYTLSSNQNLTVYATKTGSYACQSASALIPVYINTVTGGTVNGTQQVVFNGNPVAFTETLASTGETLTYQWQSSTAGSSSGFGDIASATSAVYDPPAGIQQNTWFKRITTSLKNGNSCTAESNTLSVSLAKTFLCSTSSSWNDASNWGPTGVPASTDNVVVQAPCSLLINSAGAVCNNLTIESGASLEITPGNDLTIQGTLVNNGGSAALKVSSSDLGYGSLIESTPGITGTIEQYLGGNEWHFVSSPLQDGLSGIFLHKYLQSFSEATNSYSDILPSDVPLVPFSGYAFFWGTPFTPQYVGTINTGNIGSAGNLSYSNSGWNLVGNPYPSAIDWDAASGWTKSSINNATYIHINAATWAAYVGGVGTNGGSRYIAPGQGFFVRVTSPGTGTLIVNNAAKTTQHPLFFKQGDSSADPLVRLIARGNGYSDETVIRIVQGTSDEFDPAFDAYKLTGDVEEAPQLFSAGNEILSINSIPAIRPVEIGFRSGVSGDFSIAANQFNNVDQLTLEDIKEGKMHNLLSGPYTYTYEMGESEPRFRLHMTGVGISEPVENLPAIYAYERSVCVNLHGQDFAEVRIIDITGRIIETRKLNTHFTKIPVRSSGIYIVELISSRCNVTQKVMIQ